MHEPLGRFERWGLIGGFILTCLVTVAGLAAVISTRPAPVTFMIVPPQPTGTPAPTNTPSPIIVYVTGQVVQANQLVTLPVGSRAADAVTAAGGFTQQADQLAVNLAMVLRDGQHLHIPAVGEVVTELVNPENTETMIDINNATLEELTTLPGIGPALAQRIIDYREANGPFRSFDDLDAVSGVGESIMTNLRERVTFGGF